MPEDVASSSCSFLLRLSIWLHTWSLSTLLWQTFTSVPITLRLNSHCLSLSSFFWLLCSSSPKTEVTKDMAIQLSWHSSWWVRNIMWDGTHTQANFTPGIKVKCCARVRKWLKPQTWKSAGQKYTTRPCRQHCCQIYINLTSFKVCVSRHSSQVQHNLMSISCVETYCVKNVCDVYVQGPKLTVVKLQMWVKLPLASEKIGVTPFGW